MKNAKSILGISLFLFLLSCNCERTGTPFVRVQQCFYSADIIHKICPDESCDGIRFYNAKYSKSSIETLMAVGVKDGADIFSSNYYYYRGTSNESPQYTLLNVQRAKRRSLIPDKADRYAVTFNKADLIGLLKDNEKVGIALKHALDSENYNTLEAFEAEIRDTLIVAKRGEVIVNKHPCPLYCGPAPEEDYLWDTDEVVPSDDEDDPMDKDSPKR